MSAFLKLSNWIESHRDVAFDLLRIYLGVGLLARGALFVIRPETYLALLGGADPSFLTSPTVMYLVAAVHIIGGLMLTVGLFTRLAALVQIPILVGAVFLVHFRGGLFSASQSFEFSALVLFLLVLVFLHGSGRWSVDAQRDRTYVPFRQYVERFDRSGNLAFELLRMYLGVGLFVRGIIFISNSDAFMDLVGTSSAAWLTSMVLIHYVALAHLVGGVLIAIGLFTRAAALIQIPILLGAVFVVHFQGGLMAASQSLEFSALVLFLLVLLFLWGSGALSVERYMLAQPSEAEVGRQVGSLGKRTSSPATLLSGEAKAATNLTCSCGHDRSHPRVTAQARYSVWGAMYFLTGITGPPNEIVYRCGDCGEVVERTLEKDELEEYRYP